MQRGLGQSPQWGPGQRLGSEIRGEASPLPPSHPETENLSFLDAKRMQQIRRILRFFCKLASHAPNVTVTLRPPSKNSPDLHLRNNLWQTWVAYRPCKYSLLLCLSHCSLYSFRLLSSVFCHGVTVFLLFRLTLIRCSI